MEILLKILINISIVLAILGWIGAKMVDDIGVSNITDNEKHQEWIWIGIIGSALGGSAVSIVSVITWFVWM